MEVNDMGLTTKQKRFIECFDGNATEAARQAGYSPRTVRTVGCENMTKPDIVAAIREREEKRVNSLILSREERQIFWSNVVRDPDEDMKNRLKAAELLGRSEGDFLDRIGGPNGEAILPPLIQIAFVDARKSDD